MVPTSRWIEPTILWTKYFNNPSENYIDRAEKMSRSKYQGRESEIGRCSGSFRMQCYSQLTASCMEDTESVCGVTIAEQPNQEVQGMYTLPPSVAGTTRDDGCSGKGGSLKEK